MSDIINLDFGYDDNVRRSINKAKRAIDSRINDYTGIKNELNRTECETGYLPTANSYINKKINSLQAKYDSLNSFETAVNNFNDFAEDQDKLVANRIKEETKSFCKRERIPNGPLYTIGAIFSDGLEYLKGKAANILESIKNGLVSAWETVKDWYEKNKYWIDIVVDVVVVIAAAVSLLTAGTALAAAFAVWAFLKAGSDLIFDSAAYKAYKDGDTELYKELSEKGFRDVMTCYMGDFGGGLYDAIDLAATVYGVGKLLQGGYKAVKSYRDFAKEYSKVLTPETFKGCKGQLIKDAIKQNIIGTGTYADNSVLKSGCFHNGKLLFKLPVKQINTLNYLVTLGNNILSDDSATVRIIKSFKISKTPYKVFEAFDSAFLAKSMPAVGVPGVVAI